MKIKQVYLRRNWLCNDLDRNVAWQIWEVLVRVLWNQTEMLYYNADFITNIESVTREKYETNNNPS